MLIKDRHCLESILDAIQRIKEYAGEFNSADSFNNDYRSFDAAMMNFIVLGETTGKLSVEFRQKNSEINWNKIYGLRNIIAHHYFGINVDVIWHILKTDLPVFKNQIQKLIN